MREQSLHLALTASVVLVLGSCGKSGGDVDNVSAYVVSSVQADEEMPGVAAAQRPATIASTAVAGSPDYDGLIKRGRAELGRGDYVAAVTTLRQAQKSDPGQADAYLWLSLVARAQGNERERCQLLRRYTELKPDTSAKQFYERELKKCK